MEANRRAQLSGSKVADDLHAALWRHALLREEADEEHERQQHANRCLCSCGERPVVEAQSLDHRNLFANVPNDSSTLAR